jgi:hypothetical protein
MAAHRDISPDEMQCDDSQVLLNRTITGVTETATVLGSHDRDYCTEPQCCCGLPPPPLGPNENNSEFVTHEVSF